MRELVDQSLCKSSSPENITNKQAGVDGLIVPEMMEMFNLEKRNDAASDKSSWVQVSSK